jgi:hypothetical protein
MGSIRIQSVDARHSSNVQSESAFVFSGASHWRLIWDGSPGCKTPVALLCRRMNRRQRPIYRTPTIRASFQNPVLREASSGESVGDLTWFNGSTAEVELADRPVILRERDAAAQCGGHAAGRHPEVHLSRGLQGLISAPIAFQIFMSRLEHGVLCVRSSEPSVRGFPVLMSRVRNESVLGG